jgi:hypothetical protein
VELLPKLEEELLLEENPQLVDLDVLLLGLESQEEHLLDKFVHQAQFLPYLRKGMDQDFVDVHG